MKHCIPLLFFLFVSCKPELPPVPDDIIPPEKMKLVLTDMHIADTVAETKAQLGEDERSLTRAYHEQIFKNHGVTRDRFLNSYKFYERTPELLNRMYDEILVEMSRREEGEGKEER